MPAGSRSLFTCLALLSALQLTVTAAQPPAAPGEVAITAKRLAADYETVYKFCGVPLFRPAWVKLTLSEGTFRHPASSTSEPVIVVRLDAQPARGRVERTRRIFFQSSLMSVISLQTYDVLQYRKRVDEKIDILGLHTRKDYLEIGLYTRHEHKMVAHISNEDYLTGASTNSDTALDLPRAGLDADFSNLPGLVGRVLFQQGFLETLAERTDPFVSHAVVENKLHTVTARVKSDSVKSSLTGRVPAVRVQTAVVLEERGNEVAPFCVWFAATDSLTGATRDLSRQLGIHAFPVCIRLDCSVGALVVRPTRVTGFAPTGDPVGTDLPEGKALTGR